MSANPYEQFRDRALTPTDLLALDRTVLANERTLLAYLRTALALAVVGGTLIKFFQSRWLWAVGALLLLMALVTFAIGIRRYRKVHGRLKQALGRQAGNLL